MQRLTIFFCSSIIFCMLALNFGKSEDFNRKEELKRTTLPPCKLCKVLVESFKKGMERTANSNFQGGDAAWAEEKLGDYALSELRLVEIQEKLCDDVTNGNSQCQSLAEKAESSLEEWWLKLKQSVDLFEWLCIKKLMACCPLDHYGANCVPCPGLPKPVCSGNGKCRGAGTRKGNGTCECEVGYHGMLCESCATYYYESYRDESKFLCSKCHTACRNGCNQAGPRGCAECNPGWFYNVERGCIDINECVSENDPCSTDEFCINNEGSYSCLLCDKSCNHCHGDGPDMCDECAKGYFLKDGLCIVGEEWTTSWDTRRYMTYAGLCVATCIIFQKNPAIASLIGLCVAIYVTVSEYMLGVDSSSGAPFINF